MEQQLGTAWKAHARTLRSLGHSWADIAEHLGGFYGPEIAQLITVKTVRRLCRDIKKGTANDFEPAAPIYGAAQLARPNKTEAWLRRNDPEYLAHYHTRTPPKTDALCRIVWGSERRQLRLHDLDRGGLKRLDGDDDASLFSTTARVSKTNARVWGPWHWRPSADVRRQIAEGEKRCRRAAGYRQGKAKTIEKTGTRNPAAPRSHERARPRPYQSEGAAVTAT